MMESKRSAFAVEMKAMLAQFCVTARKHGKDEAQRVATCQLVAAAAYLEDAIGPSKTREILAATIASISPDQQGVH